MSAGSGVTLSANKVLTIDAGKTTSDGVVTLTAINNDVDAADLAVTVSATASGGNGVANPADQTLTVRDDDARGVTITPKTLTVRETDDSTTNGDNESEETYTVVLDSEPAAGTVTVAVTSGDTKAATVSPPSLTFNTTNWNAAQTVTVTGVDDDTDNTDDKRTLSVTHAVSTTGDGNDYAALASADPVTVTVTDDDAAPGGIALSVDTPSVGEGADATEVTVTATVTGATRFAEAKTVAVSVGGGTATSGGDYEAVAAFNLTIPAMATSGSATFTLTPTDDDVDEDGETIDVTGSLAGTTVTKATVTLTDDDTRGVTVTGSPLTLDEADDPQTDAKENEGSYTVVLTSRPTASVTINLSAGASAPVTLDRTSLTFAPDDWNTAQTVTVTAVDDAYDNAGDERAASIAHTVVAGTSDYGSVTVDPVSVTVNDDDTAPSAITLTVDADTGTQGTQTSVAEDGGAKTVRVTATLSGSSRFPAAKTVVLAVGKATDSAKEGTDYTEVGAVSITIQANSASGSATFTLTPADDKIDDDAESLTIEGTVTGESGVTVSPASITIDDNDGAPTGIALSANPSTVAENAATAATITVTATVTGGTAYDTDTDVAITVGDADDTAKSGTDYAAVTGFTIRIPAGQTSAEGSFSLNPTNDALDEANETLSVKGASGTLKVTKATVTITDDDALPSLSIDSPSVDEGDAGDTATLTFTVTLGAASGRQVTVGYADAGTGSATSAVDYAAVSAGTLTFAPGETSKAVAVTVNGDVTDEDNETVVLRLSSPVNATVGTADGTGAITDDDAPPTVRVDNAAAVTEGDDPAVTSNMTFPVTLSAASGKTVTVAFALGGSATAGADYTAPNPLSLTIAAGTTTANILVPIKGDELDEPNETVTVTLGTLANATLNSAQGAGTATGTITDDEGTPTATLALSPAAINESGSGNESTVTATLNQATSQDLTLTVSAGAGVTLSANKVLTIDAGETESKGAVTLTAEDNDVDAADLEVTVSAVATGGNGVANPADVTLTLTDDDARGVTVAPKSLTVREADDSQTDAKENEDTYTVVLTSRPTASVTIDLSAGAGAPVTLDKTRLTFAPADWNTAQTVTVTALDDVYDNPGDERAVSIAHAIAASSGDYASLIVAPVSVTVTDDDAAPSAITLSVDADTGTQGTQTSVAEGGGAKTVRVTATISGNSRFPAETTVTLAVGKSTDSATEATDYETVTDQTITIGAGASSGFVDFTLTPKQDVLAEGAEAIGLDGTSGTLDVTGTEISLTDDDAAPTGITLTVDENTVGEGDATATTVTVTATVNGATRYTDAKTVVVSVGAGASTATSAADYAAVAAFNITIAAGAASATGTFDLTPIQDTLHEGTETIDVTGTSGTLDVTKAVISLTDDDSAPSFAVADASAAEGDAVTFTVTRSGATGAAATVKWNTAADAADDASPATAGTDYTAVTTARTLSFAVGDSAKTFTVATAEDTLAEGDETFLVELSDATGGATIATGEATGTITDDDAVPTKLTLTVDADTGTDNVQDSITEDGGAKTVRVTATLGGASTFTTATTVTVKVGASDDSATEATDYESVADQTITIAAGESSGYVDFALTPKQDTTWEDDETISLDGSAAGLDVTDTSISLTDDETVPVATLVLTPSTIAEGVSATVTATLSGASSEAVTLAVAAAPGTGAAAGDYTLTGAALSIAAGGTVSSGTVTIAATDDEVDDAGKQVTVSATATGGHGVADPTDQTLTITDNDTRGVKVSKTSLALDEVDDAGTEDAEEHIGAYTVVLESKPTASVTVTVGGADAAIATVDTDADTKGDQTTLTFTTADWDDPRTVTVTAVNDDIDNAGDRRAVTLTHAVAGADYAGESADSVAVTVTDDDTAQLSIADATAAEGGTATFKVTLSTPSAGSVTVTATTSEGSGAQGATDPEDYTHKTQALTFAAGETSKDFTVAIASDALVELDETFTVTLSGASGAAIDDGTATGTITGAGALLSISDASAREGADLTFTVTRTGDATGTASVQWSTGDDATSGARKATAGADYTAVSSARTLSFAKDETAKTLTVTSLADALLDGDETFAVTLAGPTGAVLANATGTGTITEGTTGYSIADTSAAEGEALTFAVTRAGWTGAASTVKWNTADDTADGADKATAGTDYSAQATAATLSFKAGETSADIEVSSTEDALDEPDETFRVALSAPSGSAVLTDAEAVGTITDDDGTPTVSVADATAVEEGDAGETASMTFTVTLSAASGRAVAVPYTLSGTAESGTDYTPPNPLSVTIAVGATSADIDITVTGDDRHEADETVTVTLGAPTNASVSNTAGAGAGTGQITNDDDAPTSIALSANPSTVAENAATAATITVTATVTGGTTFEAETTVAVTVGDADDTATSGEDYAAVQSFDIDIPAGATSATGSFSLNPTDDAVAEGAEKLTVSGESGDIDVESAEVTITDDEGTPTATLVLSPATIDESGADNASTVTATLDRASSKDLTLTVSAGAGVTLSANKVLTIDAGETESEGTVTLTAADNDVDAADLEVTVSATASGGNGVANPADQTLTIRDDDTRGVTVAPKTLTVRETDDSTTNGDNESEEIYTVVLDSKPAAGTVTVAVTSGDTKAATVSPESLTFNTTNWSTAQTVTVTGVDDDTDNTDDKRTLSVTHAVSTTGDGNDYGALESADPVTVTVTDDDAAPTGIALSAAPSTVAENAATAETITVTATVTGGTAYDTNTDVAITVGDADDTAKSGTDYAAVTGFTITIPAGQSSAEGSFDLNPTNDALDEANETLSVKGASGTLKVTKATVTITDDDALPSLSIDSPSVDEGDAGETAALTFTVTLDAASGRQVTVAYADAGTGSATSAVDYAAVSAGTLIFAPGETSKTIAVTVTGDVIDEDNETVVLRLSSPVNATVGTADGTGAITDDDAPPTVRVDDAAAVTEGDDPAVTANMTFPVTLSAASGKAVTVAYALGGTATAGADYTAPNPLSLTIAAGTTTANIVVPIKGDELDEPNETVTVTLGTLANATLNSAQGAGTATGTITDDEGTPTATLALSPAAINESGAGNASTVTATLNQATSQDLTLTVSAGTGVTLSANKMLTIDAGETASKGTVTLTAEDNDVDAADLEVTVSAAASGGNDIANPANQTLTVRDDDARGVTVSKASLTVREKDDGTTDSVKENEGTYTFVLDSKPAAGTVTIAVKSGDTKAATVSPASLTFNTTNWSTAQTVTVTGVDDDIDNTDDKREVSVTHGVSTAGNGNDYAALVSADPVTVTVTDDDEAPTGITLTVDENTVGEGDATATTVTVTAKVNGATRYEDAKTVVVSVGAGASTATSATDYKAVANFNITIAAGGASATGTFDLTPIQGHLARRHGDHRRDGRFGHAQGDQGYDQPHR